MIQTIDYMHESITKILKVLQNDIKPSWFYASRPEYIVLSYSDFDCVEQTFAAEL